MQSRWLWCNRAIVGGALLALSISACARSSMAPGAGAPLPVGAVRLMLRPPASQCGFAVAPYQSEYSFHGTLSGPGSDFTFVADRPVTSLTSQPLTMRLTRSGDAVTGTAGGASFDDAGYPVQLAQSPGAGSASVLGAVNSGGTVNGSVDGYVYVVHFVFSLASNCTSAQWSLQP